jgi:RAD51-like protein 1
VSATFGVPVVVTNQVTTRVGDGGHGEAVVTAALGNTWSHCVNTRLVLEYAAGGRRRVRVTKSPVAPSSSFYFEIGAAGFGIASGERESAREGGLDAAPAAPDVPHGSIGVRMPAHGSEDGRRCAGAAGAVEAHARERGCVSLGDARAPMGEPEGGGDDDVWLSASDVGQALAAAERAIHVAPDVAR